MDKKKVYTAMSGGVDSSVAVSILKDQGYNIVGVYMKTWSPEGRPCPWREERRDVIRVCAHLNVPFKDWDFTDDYKKKVVDYMISEYKKGKTPNPDIMCNKEIKFGLFFDKAISEGANMVATGHHARRRRSFSFFPLAERAGNFQFSKYKLLRGSDTNKDQSYFLWTLKQKHLKKTLFPIGEFKTKEEVREYARERKIPVAEKKDSQGVCFIGPIDVQDFLRERIEAEEGLILTVSGRVIGKHKGLSFYTIGQRRGIEVGGTGPYYVVDKKEKSNTLIVAPPSQENKLFSKDLIAEDVSFVNEVLKKETDVTAQIRYRQKAVPAVLLPLKNNTWRVTFKKPVRAITSGQSVVFYYKDELLGGGIIS